MSSRKDDGQSPRSLTAAATWSITARLAFLYAVSTILLLSIMSGVLFWVMSTFVEQQQRDYLAEEIEELKPLLHVGGGNRELLEHEIIAEAEALQDGVQKHSQYTRVTFADSLTIETPGMSNDVPRAIFAELAERGLTSGNWTAPDGRRYLLMSVVHSTSPGSDASRIHGALDVTSGYHLVADYQRFSIVLLLFGIVISVMLGIAISRRGMRPLQEITESMQYVTGNRLHARMGHRNWPSELDALVSAFDQMLDRLEEAFSRLSQFSADLAHEFRTPINRLMIETEVALSRDRTGEEYRQVLESSMENCERLSRMTESLLFLARADSSQSPIKRQRVDAIMELESVREFYGLLADEKGVHFHCSGVASIEVDPMLFRRAVGNLVSNAIRHTPRGGTIVLSSELQTDGAVRVSVSDTGCGIEKQHLHRIFDRFYRVDTSRSENKEGSGLGLAIVKSIMILHGGSVVVESVPGLGTTVMLSFPAGSGVQMAATASG